MNKEIDVPKGKEVVSVRMSEHTHIRLLNSKGEETFRFDSPGNHVSAVVPAGRYTIETDGKLGEVEYASLPSHLPGLSEADATKPPAQH